MEAFAHLLSFMGLLLGFTLTEIAKGFSGALKRRHLIRIGWLTPLLAILFMLDIADIWTAAWYARSLVDMSTAGAFALLAWALTYYLSASMIFPDLWDDVVSLDDWFFANKHWVVCGLIATSIASNAVILSLERPEIDAGLIEWAAIMAGWFVLLAALAWVRSARWSYVLLALALALELQELVAS